MSEWIIRHTTYPAKDYKQALKGDSNDSAVPAVSGNNTAPRGDGVSGNGWRGVVGVSKDFQGVFGKSVENAGVVGVSDKMHGVYGDCHNPNGGGVYGTNDRGGFGVIGVSATGIGVQGDSKTGKGVVGLSNDFQGVFGKSVKNAGVVGESDQLHGVYGDCHNPNGGGVYGTNDRGGFGVIGVSASGIGVSGKGGRLAGRFEGDVEVTGDIRLANADCAEDFDIADAGLIEAGTVMVLGDEGALHRSHQAYDKRVAGVVSGAGSYKPGIVLDKQTSQSDRKPIALLGKVYCKADATYGSITVGDLLTTSPSPGHAMKAADQSKAFGAVIGKALRPLRDGQGLIPILIALQ